MGGPGVLTTDLLTLYCLLYPCNPRRGMSVGGLGGKSSIVGANPGRSHFPSYGVRVQTITWANGNTGPGQSRSPSVASQCPTSDVMVRWGSGSHSMYTAHRPVSDLYRSSEILDLTSVSGTSVALHQRGADHSAPDRKKALSLRAHLFWPGSPQTTM